MEPLVAAAVATAAKADLKEITVRELSKEEGVVRLRPIITAFGRESGLCEQFGLPVDFTHFKQFLEVVMANDIGGAFIAEQHGRIIGTLVYSVTAHPFTGVKSASEIAWYVYPDFRHTSAGVRLYRSFEKCMKEQGVKLLMMIYLENSMPDRLRRFYEKIGFEKVETNYVKQL